jgi:hypothetical protein
MAEISAARMKSPSLIIAGKARAIEASHFNNVSHYCIDQFASGRTTGNTLRRWLPRLGVFYGDAEPLWLIFDCCTVHWRLEMKPYPAEPEINLLFLLTRLTNALPALDRFAFAVMKLSHRSMYRAHMSGFGAMAMHVTARFLMHLSEAVNKPVRDEVWVIHRVFRKSGASEFGGLGIL